MKNLYLILLLALSLTNCKAQQQNTKLMIPKIDKTFETFDITIFEDKGSRHDTQIDDKHIIYTRANVGYGKVVFFKNSYFKKIKSFYPNKNIRKKGAGFNNGSEYGIWYEFDKKGNLTEEINTDEGYDFGWEQVIKYCENNKIALTKGYDDSGFHTSIYKQEENGKKTWVITYQLPVGDKLMEITLDGKTGKEIKRKELDFIGG